MIRCIKVLVLSSVLMLSGKAIGQLNSLSIGYFGPFGIEPGLNVGVQMNLKSSEKDEVINTYYLAPHLGSYIKPNYHTDIMLGIEGGIHRQKAEKKGYSQFGLGLSYLSNFELISFTVNFNGEISNREHEHRGYLVPTISYEYGRKVNDAWGWYIKPSVGRRISFAREGAGAVFVEAGVKFNLNQE